MYTIKYCLLYLLDLYVYNYKNPHIYKNIHILLIDNNICIYDSCMILNQLN